MGLYINTNTASINARRRLTSSTNAMGRSFERLSSGLRINSAKDDAAGLAITNRMTAQIRGLDQAVRNSNDGISMAQTAEGAMQETTNLIQRMRELAVQAASDSNNESDRISLQEEISQLIAEVDRISVSTNFNGNKILDGSIINNVMQVGANVGETLSVRIQKMDANELGRQMRRTSAMGVDTSVGIDNAAGDSLVINGTTIRDTVTTDDSLSTSMSANSAIAKAAAINDASEFTGVRAISGPTEATGSQFGVQAGDLDETNYFTINGHKFGGFVVQANDSDGTLVDAINSAFGETGVLAKLDAAGNMTLTAEDGRNIEVTLANATVANVTGLIEPTIAGATVTANLSAVYGGQITLQSENPAEIIFGTNTNVGLGNVRGDVPPQPGPGLAIFGTTTDSSVNDVDITTREGATEALDILDLALDQIASQRASLGAIQNRLESTINSLTTNSENLSASRSRILDADFASETANLSRNQIIQQAGVSILAQANQQPQIALSLLGG